MAAKTDKDYIKEILTSLPENPGCYQYLDETGKVIYVGKAKNLKRRVNSYFNKLLDSSKTQMLVKKIRDIKYIVVKTEEDALLLENNLIKKHQPHYNVLLKDDKTYPSIVIKKEYLPRVFSTRNIIKDGSVYFGPYSSIAAMKAILQAIKDIYPLRSCKYAFSPENIASKKYPVCLQYHIKNCLGPCQQLQTEKEYMRNIAEIKNILEGNISRISKQIFDEMTALSENLQFEKAQLLKEKYKLIEKYKAKSEIVNPNLSDIDVFSYDDNKESAYINYFHIMSGNIVQGYTIEYKKRLDEPKEEILGLGIVELRSRFQSKTSEIIVPFIPNIQLTDVHFIIPQRGDKKKLLELSVQNVRQYKIDQLKKAEKLNPEQRTTRILTTLKNDLHLQDLPFHIECFDNSNIQGTNPVSSCVVFKKAKPSRSDYRHFNIKTVIGPDDFSSMYETVSRRYKRLSEEGTPLPQLIVIDGGKGQLHAATNALKDLGIYGKIAIIGIAKRLEEIYFPEDSVPLYLDKNSESLKLIQQLRDEAHHFGITFHRKKRSIQQVKSELDDIKGIGEKLKTILLKHYKSVKKIKEAPPVELENLIGKKKATLLINGLKYENSHPAR
ncbi:MAG: excinuclease ABC subunit UvrC [Dysgonamonadaceae bacterium]|jgi:excinuclease ABC subunit C|nr:excinuclease ABC subunit UvrC [Dysgonamonadaceae bacterium]